MNDPLIAKFAAACGAVHPLNLRVGLADGGVLAEGLVHQPFTLIGRDDACDVTLNDQDINPRHAWFQTVGGRVFALDLGSRAGMIWPDGPRRSGWLDVETPLRIGSFHVQLLAPVSPSHQRQSQSQSQSSRIDPLSADPNLGRSRPAVHLEFRNGKRMRDRWAINRTITLVGRSDFCKLHLHAEDISSYHCGLVLTPSGLWVVDLSGRGVVVNGERMRVAPLAHGAELWVGRFLIGCQYPAPAEPIGPGRTPAAGQPTGPGSGRYTPASGMPTRPIRVTPIFAEDEVPLGGMPVHDPASGLPSSHILCDAFQTPSSGPISSPILVASASPTPPNIPIPVPHRPPFAAPPPETPTPSQPIGDSSVAPLLKQLSEINGHLFEQFQQSLVLMAKLVGRLEAGDSSAMRKELSRIEELNVELARLQGEVARRSLSEASPSRRVTASDPTPLPGTPPLDALVRAPIVNEAIQEWVEERIGALQHERRRRWEKLSGLVAGDPQERETIGE